MEYNIGTVVTLKKGHPCGTNEWEIIRTGADFKLLRSYSNGSKKNFRKKRKEDFAVNKKTKALFKTKRFRKKIHKMKKKSLNTGTFFDIIVIRDIY